MGKAKQSSITSFFGGGKLKAVEKKPGAIEKFFKPTSVKAAPTEEPKVEKVVDEPKDEQIPKEDTKVAENNESPSQVSGKNVLTVWLTVSEADLELSFPLPPAPLLALPFVSALNATFCDSARLPLAPGPAELSLADKRLKSNNKIIMKPLQKTDINDKSFGVR